MVGAVIARQLLGRGPGVYTIFLAGAFLTVATGALSVAGAESALAGAAPVLLFLFSLFLFAGALEKAGALDHLARWIVGRANRAENLPAVVFVGFGVVSAFLVNDALVLIGVPLVLSVARRVRTDPRPLLLTLAFAVTVGSVLTPFGNPQNLLVAVGSGLADPVTTFLRYLLLPTAVNLAVGAWYLRRVFGPGVAPGRDRIDDGLEEAPPLLPTGGWGGRLYRSPVLYVFPGTLLVAITLDLASAISHGPSVPLWETTGAGAILLLLLSPGRRPIVERVDWTILLLFVGLFVVVASAVRGGVIGSVESHFPIAGPGAPIASLAAIMGTSVLGAQVVSNVPWVGLQIPLLAGLGYGPGTPVAWMALAAASTLAGNVTLLGAASNLIVVELAEKEGIPIRLGTFVRYGLPLSAVCLAVVFALLALGL